MIGKIFAVIILLGLLYFLLGRWIFIPFLILLILFLVRVIADLFWIGKNNEWW